MALHDVIITKVTIQYEGNGLQEFEEALKANKSEKIKNLNSYLEYNGAKIDIKEKKIILEVCPPETNVHEIVFDRFM